MRYATRRRDETIPRHPIPPVGHEPPERTTSAAEEDAEAADYSREPLIVPRPRPPRASPRPMPARLRRRSPFVFVRDELERRPSHLASSPASASPRARTSATASAHPPPPPRGPPPRLSPRRRRRAELLPAAPASVPAVLDPSAARSRAFPQPSRRRANDPRERFEDDDGVDAWSRRLSPGLTSVSARRRRRRRASSPPPRAPQPAPRVHRFFSRGGGERRCEEILRRAREFFERCPC